MLKNESDLAAPASSEFLTWLAGEFSPATIAMAQELIADLRPVVSGTWEDGVEIQWNLPHPTTSRWQAEKGTELLDGHCTCTQFSQGVPCAHLWATALMAPPFAEVEPVNRWVVLFQFLDYQDQDLSGSEVTPTAPAADWRELLNGKIDRTEVDPKLRQDIGRAGKKPPGKITMRRRGPLPSALKRIAFAVDLRQSQERKRLVLRFFAQDIQPSGELSAPKPILLNHSILSQFPDPAEKKILWSLIGKSQAESELGSLGASSAACAVLMPESAHEILLEIHASSKLLLLDNRYVASRPGGGDLLPLPLRTEPWFFQLHLRPLSESFFLQASLSNGRSQRRLQEILGVFEPFVLFREELILVEVGRYQRWVDSFTRRRDVEVPRSELDAFLQQYLATPDVPTLTLPDNLQFREITPEAPKVRLVFSSIEGSTFLQSRMEFHYGPLTATWDNHAEFLYDIAEKARVRRDLAFEEEVRAKFQELGPSFPTAVRLRKLVHDGVFEPRKFVQAAEAALAWGWEVFAHRQQVSRHTHYQTTVSAHLDWFDLKTTVDFGAMKMQFPDLLQNLRSGERLLRLTDGSYGILPAEWLEKIRPWVEIGAKVDGGVRLSQVQALFLASSWQDGEASLAGDQRFQRLGQILTDLKGLKGRAPGSQFVGELRPYQQEGLAWLDLITAHKIGGILADDMGLGKTIQILALLAELPKQADQPHLIVAPKSLIFNWIQEAAKFTPQLRVLDFTGPQRHANQDKLQDYDVVLTTYQTLRADIERLQKKNFDFFILDEAQFIKNPDSQAAMACRLIKAQKRVALSGTPVENSLSDLFSILSVVTPGLLSESQMRRWVRLSMSESREGLSSLAKALRPFILRRSKTQVLRDLPEKTEQILYCELSTEERRRYEELRQHYWSLLGDRLLAGDFNKARLEVLEALLRLRQASCHQGLLDEGLRSTSSAKFELLLSQLEQVIADGHKALVFSQFTSLLDLFRHELHARHIRYEYLDGQTQNRQQRVERFQADPEIPLFLLSLKAGGVGLNLTAADYVFILDPWWNPATETQAIDRTHRIGQNKKVFAYKLIAKNTVEEKILELQKRKRELANQVISDENSVFKSMTLQDLRELFAE